METGRVRTVLALHARARAGAAPSGDDPAWTVDAAGFVPADVLRTALATLPPAGQRAAAHDYVALWARTFPALVRHLRGRPVHALRIFCDEVYPFLRGERRAARIQSRTPGGARVLLASDLPPDYLCGMLEAFVALSRADAHATAAGVETYDVTFRVHPADRVAYALRALTVLHIPMLVTAAGAVATGIALAARAGRLDPSAALLAALGALAAQAGAIGVHRLRSERTVRPLTGAGLGLTALWTITVLAYSGAAAVAAALFMADRPWVVLLAVTGLALGASYRWLRDRGMGPLLAGIVHGPLIVGGTLYVVAGPTGLTPVLPWLVASAAPGLVAAALVYLDDLADRPLDEASGKRTLAVRIPQTRHVAGYALLAGLALVAAGAAAWHAGPPAAVLVTGAAIPPVLLLVRSVQANVDDPRGLTRARLGTLGLHVAVTTTLALLWGLAA